jgi:hypothetical protein
MPISNNKARKNSLENVDEEASQEEDLLFSSHIKKRINFHKQYAVQNQQII